MSTTIRNVSKTFLKLQRQSQNKERLKCRERQRNMKNQFNIFVDFDGRHNGNNTIKENIIFRKTKKSNSSDDDEDDDQIDFFSYVYCGCEYCGG